MKLDHETARRMLTVLGFAVALVAFCAAVASGSPRAVGNGNWLVGGALIAVLALAMALVFWAAFLRSERPKINQAFVKGLSGSEFTTLLRLMCLEAEERGAEIDSSRTAIAKLRERRQVTELVRQELSES